MPKYTYRCANVKCQHQFEQRQLFTDDPLELCPACQRLSLRRVISIPNIQFKAPGFYITDNKKGEDDDGV
jgi:putative FmdB family regulatory protein